jgi:hypothetical protein
MFHHALHFPIGSQIRECDAQCAAAYTDTDISQVGNSPGYLLEFFLIGNGYFTG